jgi:cytosine/adenosine deaminase-related metal-dependent hydrolase
MRKIAANYIFPVAGKPVKNGYLVLDDKGTIMEVVDTGGQIPEIEGLEYYSGVLVPGFINAHNHVELSHMHNTIEQGLGMDEFVSQIPKNRWAEPEVIRKATFDQMAYMYSRGTNGLGDISNTADAFEAKKESKMHTYSFVEVFQLGDMKYDEITGAALAVDKQLGKMGLKGSYVPHAPYSVPENLYDFIRQNTSKGKIGSFHFREHPQERERELYTLKQQLGYLLVYDKLLMIHNIHLSAEEKLTVECEFQRQKKEVYWCLCPNSNLFIGGKLPDFDMFLQAPENVCLGTDSLASNTKLSVLEEMKTIVKNQPNIDFSTLLQWATINGAKALGMEKALGSFEHGKEPGVLLLENFDFANMQISGSTEVKRLV